MPVIATLDALDVDVLVRILTEPRNAIIKQYQRILHWDGVELEVTDDALAEIAREAIKRKTGARALRSILEELMLDVMYEIPSMREAVRVVIDADCVRDRKSPRILTAKDTEARRSA